MATIFGDDEDNTIDGTSGDDTIWGGKGADTLNGAGGIDVLNGGLGSDIVNGDDGNDTLNGGNGDDTLNGGADKDRLNGNPGNDHLNGGDGNDLLDGGAGADVMDGGAGRDRFHYGPKGGPEASTGTSYDTIVNFDASEDKIGFHFTVNQVNAVGSGHLSDATFETDLANAVGSGQMSANQAALFNPDSGDHSGETFLVVDQNGTAGYQAGEDYVIRLDSALNMQDFGTGSFT
jgi:Ca2+-binding RTX toxin-like protein